MNKLKTVIQYECTTSFKYIWIFYAIQYAAVALICAIIAISMGSLEGVGISCLETNTLFYVGVLGILGFKEDFKMLIQNGFTRKYIFLGTSSMFMFISAILAFIDTIVGNVLHHTLQEYSSIFGSIYGYENIVVNWLWLFLVYMLVCSFLYLIILTINKIGKISSICLGVVLGTIVLLIPALFRFVLPNAFANNLITLATKAMGFMSNGTINFICPLLTLLLFIGIFSICSYNIICRTEL